MIATAIDERTTIPLTWAFTFLGASLAAAFYVGIYIKGVKEALVGIKAAADTAHGAALAANHAAGAANLEAKLAREELNAAIKSLPCNSSKTILPRKCTKPL